MKMLLLCLFSLPVFAGPPKDSALVTLRGSLTANAKPVTSARFWLAPAESHTAIELDRAGKFELKAMASREYTVHIDADGYAPTRLTVAVNELGVGELGAVKLEALKLAKVSVVVAPRGALASAPLHPIELQHWSCANVRAQDDSGCLLSFCTHQQGASLEIDRSFSGGQLRTMGKVSLVEALAQVPRGTFVTGDQPAVTLREGETVAGTLNDPYCGAMLHVDAVKARCPRRLTPSPQLPRAQPRQGDAAGD